MFIKICDECGAKDAEMYCLETGYVYIDEELHSQSVDLCKEHYPLTGSLQPNKYERVWFIWPRSEG